MNPSKPLYHRRRFPAEVFSHCVWLYFRFSLSYRDVEEMMAYRGVVVSYESIQDRSLKFGGLYAKRLKSRAKGAGDYTRTMIARVNATQPLFVRENTLIISLNKIIAL